MESSKFKVIMTTPKPDNPLANTSTLSQFLEKSSFNNISKTTKKATVSNSVIN